MGRKRKISIAELRTSIREELSKIDMYGDALRCQTVFATLMMKQYLALMWFWALLRYYRKLGGETTAFDELKRAVGFKLRHMRFYYTNCKHADYEPSKVRDAFVNFGDTATYLDAKFDERIDNGIERNDALIRESEDELNAELPKIMDLVLLGSEQEVEEYVNLL